MRVVRFLVGMALAPVCCAVTGAVLELAWHLHPAPDALPGAGALAAATGFVLWLLLYFTAPRPVRTYILAHELTHALWAAVMGANVVGFNVGRNGGSVTLSRSNVLITLAPYFFPLYTVLLILLYYTLSLFFAVERYSLLWLGLVGFSWGFHFTFTVAALLQRQTDIHHYGRLFSYTLIYGLNVLGIGIWLVMVSPATLEQLIELLAGYHARLAAGLGDAAAGWRAIME